jgi:hypothetical protein
MKKVKVRAPKLPCIGCGKNTAIGLCRTCRLIDLFGSMLTAIVDSTSLLRR